MKSALAIGVVTLVFAISSCSSAGNGSQLAQSIQQPGVVYTTNPHARCHALHVVSTDNEAWEPDHSCSPGAIDGGIPASQLCHTSTKTVRPPSSYTDPLKRTQIADYGWTPTNPKAYEEDHIISLELGGAPRDPLNLWPEPGASINEKDKVEDRARALFCAGKLDLTTAQQGLANDWHAFGKQIGALP